MLNQISLVILFLTFKKKYSVFREYGLYYKLYDPFVVACREGHLNDVVRYVESGTVTDVNKDGGGHLMGGVTRTPLGVAAESEQYEIVAYLLTLPGINVGAVDSTNCTPIHYAAEKNKKKLDVLKCLLNHKTCSFDVLHKKVGVSTALDYAKKNFGPIRNDIIQLLKSKGLYNSEILGDDDDLRSYRV